MLRGELPRDSWAAWLAGAGGRTFTVAGGGFPEKATVVSGGKSQQGQQRGAGDVELESLCLQYGVLRVPPHEHGGHPVIGSSCHGEVHSGGDTEATAGGLKVPQDNNEGRRVRDPFPPPARGALTVLRVEEGVDRVEEGVDWVEEGVDRGDRIPFPRAAARSW